MCLLHVSVFCKLQDFIKHLCCCVTCLQPGDADGDQSTEASVTKYCGGVGGWSVLALVIRYERGGEAAGDRGPGQPVSQQGKSSAVESTRAPGSGRGELGPEKMVKS